MSFTIVETFFLLRYRRLVSIASIN